MLKLRRVVVASWLGFALAALFFFPLTSVLADAALYLQWQPYNSLETASAIALLAVPLGLLVFAAWPRRGVASTLMLASAALFPILSLGGAVVRLLPGAGVTRDVFSNSTVGMIVAATLIALAAAALKFAPDFCNRLLRSAIIVISPASLLVVGVLGRAALAPGATTTIERAAVGKGQCSSVLALLFDEMSYAYLYDDNRVADAFPHLQAFSAVSTNYLAANSPGSETTVSVLGYLGGRRYDGVGLRDGALAYQEGGISNVFSGDRDGRLFQDARRSGYRTEVAGYYLPYCELLNGVVDRCRSFSFYNASTVDPVFSPWHPVATTLIFWPRQFPLGLVKSGPFAALQHANVDATRVFANSPLSGNGPVFRLVHFSVPHLPFVFDAGGYRPPLDASRQSDERYVNQLRYVDRIVGEVTAALEANGESARTTVAIFSDHGFRAGTRELDVRHVPFLVHHPAQASRSDVTDVVPAERILGDLAAQCR